MSAPIHVTAGNHAGPTSERGLEVYPTPPCAVEALVRAEPLPQGCWEACGSETSAIAMVLGAHGHHVVCTDIADDGIDFRNRTEAPPGVEAIVANPPFSQAADFVQRGLLLVSKVMILERIQFLESNDREDLYKDETLARVLYFVDRVPRMHQEGWAGKKAAPAMFLAWFIFERSHRGDAVLRRIRCQPKTRTASHDRQDQDSRSSAEARLSAGTPGFD